MKRPVLSVDGNRWNLSPQDETGLILFTKSGKDFEIYFDWTSEKLKVEIKHIKDNKVIKTLFVDTINLT
jgi:phosphopantothenate synthetase